MLFWRQPNMILFQTLGSRDGEDSIAFSIIIAAGNLVSIYRRFGGICYLSLHGKCDSYTGNRSFHLKFGD